MKNYDSIIIGGGLGGLIAGAKLTKKGKKVLLIEQHNIVGGCATNFKRSGSNMDAGLHMIDGLDEGDLKRKIFEELKIFENIEFIRVPEFYRVTNGSFDIVIPDDYKEAEKMLIQKFPEEKRGIKKFFNGIIGLRNELKRMPRGGIKMLVQLPFFPLLYPRIFSSRNKTVSQFLDKIIKNDDLKLILAANTGYYHDTPETLSWLYFAIGQAGYYNGGYYIKSGSQNLSDYLAKFIKENGGDVLLGNKVMRILTEGNKAIGIEYKKTSGVGKPIEVYGKSVIANAAIPNIFNDLLPEKLVSTMKPNIERMKIANSLLSIYLFFKTPIKELGNRNYSTIVYSSNVRKLQDFDYHENFHERGFVFVDYNQIDSQLAAPGKGVGVICTVDYIDHWEKLSKEEYQGKKDDVAKIFIERLNSLIPGVKDQVEYYEVGTPKTIMRYTSNPQGAAYGFAQIPSQAGIKRIPQKSPIENLYFASAWTMPGGGFSGAILSGWFCADEVLKKLGI